MDCESGWFWRRILLYFSYFCEDGPHFKWTDCSNQESYCEFLHHPPVRYWRGNFRRRFRGERNRSKCTASARVICKVALFGTTCISGFFTNPEICGTWCKVGGRWIRQDPIFGIFPFIFTLPVIIQFATGSAALVDVARIRAQALDLEFFPHCWLLTRALFMLKRRRTYKEQGMTDGWSAWATDHRLETTDYRMQNMDLRR